MSVPRENLVSFIKVQNDLFFFFSPPKNCYDTVNDNSGVKNE